MIYFRQFFGGAHPLRVYGLRLEQASLPPTSPAASLASLTRRRELVSLEFAPHTDTRLQFGRRVIWDVGRHEFAVGAMPSYNAFHLWGDSTFSSCSAQLSCIRLQAR
jgi:hypothetical protein